MNQQLLMMQGLQADELALINDIVKGMTEAQEQQFYLLYMNKRRDQQTLMLLCLVGFVGFAGLHRLVTNDIGLGVLYFFTAGFCFIGTIIDLININSLAFEFNRRQAMETAQMVKMVMK